MQQHTIAYHIVAYHTIAYCIILYNIIVKLFIKKKKTDNCLLFYIYSIISSGFVVITL